MYIDPVTKIIFIHNPKAAGIAVRRALLLDGVGTESQRFKIKNDHLNRVSSHSFASRVKEHPRVRDWYDDAFSFGIIRNPWERAVSLWEYSKHVDGGQTMLRHGLRNLGDRKKDVACNDAVRNGFIYWMTKWVDRYQWCPWDYMGPEGVGAIFKHNQHDWFHAHKTLIVSKVYKLEHLNRLADDLSNRLGRDIKIKRANETKHGHYRKYYDRRSRMWIASRFAKDIKRYGFEF